jgi:hypothetical protein
MKIEYRVQRGSRVGAVHTPHHYADGTYVVSKTRYTRDYVHVHSLKEVLSHLDRGYRLRVSDPMSGM